jgi:hypothetical protein
MNDLIDRYFHVDLTKKESLTYKLKLVMDSLPKNWMYELIDINMEFADAYFIKSSDLFYKVSFQKVNILKI